MMDLYETLGAARTDDDATIKTAYRKRAQATHPDREGGDQQAFQAIQQAYDVLSDPERRARYDATGQFTGHVEDKRATILAQVADLLMQLIEAVDVKHTDLIARAVQQVELGNTNLVAQRKQHENKIETKKEALSRLTGGSDSIVNTMIERAIRAHEDIITQIDGAMQRNQDVIDLLHEYTYRADVKPVDDLSNLRWTGGSTYDPSRGAGLWSFPTT